VECRARQGSFAFVVAALTLLLLSVPAAHAAGVTFTVTGKEGRDDLFVFSDGQDLFFSPAVALVANPSTGDGDRGQRCTTESDLLTGRPTLIRCDPIRQEGPAGYALNVDLRGGNDTISVQPNSLHPERTDIVGGAGDDAINVAAGGTQIVRGGDGDDTLSTGGIDTPPVTLDGGAGRDLVDYLGVQNIPSCRPGGLTVSLRTGTASLLIARCSSGDIVRQDTLAGVERLSGTVRGDILAGGPGADELIGEGGPDNLSGDDGNDMLFGSEGEDVLDGGPTGVDTLDGGPGEDVFRQGAGDTFLTRDGVGERVGCLGREIVMNDLVDVLSEPTKCLSVSTAAAKHRFDTRLSGRRLRVGTRRRVRARVTCPRAKADRCSGELRLRLGGARGAVFATRRYRLQPGRAAKVELPLSAREARRIRRRAVTLDARETDGDGRPRRVLRRTSVR